MNNKYLILIVVLVCISIISVILGGIVYTVDKFETIREAVLDTTPKKVFKQEMVLFKNNIEKETIHFKKDTTYTLHYWASWCKPCLKELSNLQTPLPKNTYYISIEDSASVNDFLNKRKFSFPLYRMDSIEIPYTPQEIKYYPSSVMIKNETIVNHK